MDKPHLFLLDPNNEIDYTPDDLLAEMKQKQKELEKSLSQLAKKSRYENIIRSITQSVHSSLDIQEVFENAVESISENVIEVRNVSIHIVEDNKAVIKAYRGFPDWFIPRIESIPYPKDFTWKTILDQKLNYCSDVDKENTPGRVGREIGTKSFLSMPVFLNMSVVGVINITSGQKNIFDKDELDLLELVAKQIETAIKNAKRAEALKESEKRYRTLFENVPTGIYRTTPDGMILDVNPALIQMLGYSSQEELALNKIAKKLFTLKCIRFKENIDKDGGEIRGMESVWEKKDKTRIYVNENVRAVRSTDGTVLYYEGTVEDITKRKKAEADLRNVNNSLETKVSLRTKALSKTNEKLKTEIFERKGKEKQLKKSHKQLRKLTKHLESVREDERIRISREVHDELGQALTGLKMDLTCLKNDLDSIDDRSSENILETRIEDMFSLIDSTVQVVRRIAMDLRPGLLDDVGTVAAIEWQLQDFEKQTGIKCTFKSDVDEMMLDKEPSTAVFRIFREALTNVARHAKATGVEVRIEKSGNEFLLAVKDNGKGILEEEVYAPKSLGLLGINERALLFGGKVNIEGIPGKGTMLTLAIPLKREEDD